MGNGNPLELFNPVVDTITAGRFASVAARELGTATEGFVRITTSYTY